MMQGGCGSLRLVDVDGGSESCDGLYTSDLDINGENGLELSPSFQCATVGSQQATVHSSCGCPQRCPRGFGEWHR